MVENMNERAIEASIKFFERRFDGVEGIERFNDDMMLVADMGNELVFVKVLVVEGSDLPDETPELRKEFEKFAMGYLANSSKCDIAVRFDVVTIGVMGNDRAFLRYHYNATNDL